MSEHFHDTIGKDGNDLHQARLCAIAQENLILELFKSNRMWGLTPSEVHKMTGISLITSVRRAMTNLTEEGHLTKTPLKRMGPHNELEHVWIMSADYKEMKGIFD